MYILKIKLSHSLLTYHPLPNTYTYKKTETNAEPYGVKSEIPLSSSIFSTEVTTMRSSVFTRRMCH